MLTRRTDSSPWQVRRRRDGRSVKRAVVAVLLGAVIAGAGGCGLTGGDFTAVTVGTAHACGLRADGTVACWGVNDDGQAEAPSGGFTALSAGASNTCGLRTDGTLVCWGRNDDQPAGRFSAVAAGGDGWCALRLDNTVECGDLEPLGRTFSAVARGGHHACGLRSEDGSVNCWPVGYWKAKPHPGPFSELTIGPEYSCGLRVVDGAAVCWSPSSGGGTNVFAGPFTAIAAGAAHTCGLHTDNTLQCWGIGQAGQVLADAPSGKFESFDAGSFLTCGVRINGNIICWGLAPPPHHDTTDAPRGVRINHKGRLRSDAPLDL